MNVSATNIIILFLLGFERAGASGSESKRMTTTIKYLSEPSYKKERKKKNRLQMFAN